MARSTEAELEQRIQEIYHLLLRREPYQNIVRFGSGKWGIGSRQVDEYISRARELMREEARADRDVALAEHIAIRRDLFNKAYKDQKWAIAFQIVQDESKLLGLYFDLADHLKAVVAAGYVVYEPNSPEAAEQDRAAAEDIQCEVEIGLAYPPDGGSSMPEAV